MTTLPEKPWFPIAEAAALLGITRMTIYNRIQAGDLEVKGSKYHMRVSRQSLLRIFFTD